MAEEQQAPYLSESARQYMELATFIDRVIGPRATHEERMKELHDTFGEPYDPPAADVPS